MRLHIRLFFAIAILLILGVIFCSLYLWPLELPGGEVVCGDRMAHADAWEDLDADGQRDPNEPPLAGVCIGTVDNPARLQRFCQPGESVRFTNQEGRWHSAGFVAGGCSMFDDLEQRIVSQCARLAISAIAPQGYRATTPVTTRGCDAQFGFVKETASPSP